MNHHQPTGGQLRDEGVTAAIAADTAAHRGHRDAIEQALDELITSGRAFTADDIRSRLPAEVQERIPPPLLPAVLRAACQRGLIRHVGWASSTRATRHAGPLRRWVGVPVSAVPEQRRAS